VSGRIPLLLLTGFLGVGKTTLLSHWLKDPEFSQAAVIMNELGRIRIDPHLVGTAAVMRAEEEGCFCCTIRGALGTALEDLVLQQRQRRVPHFSRVVVEASGLAEPAPLLDEIDRSQLVSDSYRLEGVVTAVDAVEGERQLDARREAFAQVLVADTLIVTKTDLADPADVERLEARLAAVNPWAALIRSASGDADPRRVVEALRDAPGRSERRRIAAGRFAESSPLAGPTRSLADVHGRDLRAVTVQPPAPLDPESLRSRLEAFLEHHGTRVLRIKGLVAIAGQPGPAVVHAVAGVLYPVRLLARWPEGASSAMVVITQGLPEDAVTTALEEAPV
jgi:G3E family GTPase